MPISASPRNPLLGLLADGLQGAYNAGSAPFGYENPPVKGLLDLLSVPALAKTLDTASYGGGLTRGTGYARRLTDDTSEALMALPLGNPAGAGAKAIGKTAARELGPLAAQKAEQFLLSQGAVKPITAYHGTPHKFDKFDNSKMGTGEGAQVYGAGAYLADNPAVADEYRRMLSANQPNRYLLDGVEYPSDSPAVTAQGFFDKFGSVDKAKEALAKVNVKNKKQVIAELDKAPSRKMETQTGYLYKADIPDEAVANMLLWDKPLSEQPEAVRSAIGTINEDALAKYRQSIEATDEPVSKSSITPSENSLLESIFNDPYFLEMEKNMPSIEQMERQRIDAAVNSMRDILGNKKGSGYYKELSGIYGTPEATSQRLQSLGIPGIRYLDQGSRGAGAGTMNTVVFDDSLIKILERNGVPMGGLLGD